MLQRTWGRTRPLRGRRSRQGKDSDMLDSGCIERLAASLQRGPRRHHVIDQHDLPSRGALRGAKRGRHVGVPLPRGQTALLSGSSQSLQQLRGKRCADAPGQRVSQQSGGIEAALDQPRIVEGYRHYDSLRRDAVAVREGPRQQESQRSRQVGSVAEFEAPDRCRKRRNVAAADGGGHHSGDCWSSGARATTRAEDRAYLDGGVASSAIVGSDRVDDGAHARTRHAGEALPTDHPLLIVTRTTRLRSQPRDPSDRRPWRAGC